MTLGPRKEGESTGPPDQNYSKAKRRGGGGAPTRLGEHELENAEGEGPFNGAASPR